VLAHLNLFSREVWLLVLYLKKSFVLSIKIMGYL